MIMSSSDYFTYLCTSTCIYCNYQLHCLLYYSCSILQPKQRNAALRKVSEHSIMYDATSLGKRESPFASRHGGGPFLARLQVRVSARAYRTFRGFYPLLFFVRKFGRSKYSYSGGGSTLSYSYEHPVRAALSVGSFEDTSVNSIPFSLPESACLINIKERSRKVTLHSTTFPQQRSPIPFR